MKNYKNVVSFSILIGVFVLLYANHVTLKSVSENKYHFNYENIESFQNLADFCTKQKKPCNSALKLAPKAKADMDALTSILRQGLSQPICAAGSKTCNNTLAAVKTLLVTRQNLIKQYDTNLLSFESAFVPLYGNINLAIDENLVVPLSASAFDNFLSNVTVLIRLYNELADNITAIEATSKAPPPALKK